MPPCNFDSLELVPAVDLLPQAQPGSKDALLELIRRNEPALRWVIRRKLDRRCRRLLDVEDLLQEIRIDFWRRTINSQVFQSLQEFLNYLLRAAVNKAKEANRHWLASKTRNLARDCDEAKEDWAYEGELFDVTQELEDEAVATYLRLPFPVNYIYFMRMQKGTVVQIADILTMSQRSVYRALIMAEGRLKVALTRERH